MGGGGGQCGFLENVDTKKKEKLPKIKKIKKRENNGNNTKSWKNMRVCPPETFMLYHSNSNLRGTVKVPSKKLRGPRSWPISEVGWGGWPAGTLLDLDLASQLVCLASGKSLPKGSTTSGTITSVSMLAWMKCESTLRFGGRRAPGARQGRVPGAITGGVCFCLRFSLAFLNISLVLKF